MKKFLLFLLLIIMFGLPCYAEYKPIPEHLREQYKAEMEQIIDDGYPQAIKNIDNYIHSVRINYNKIISKEDDNIFSLTPEVSIFDLDLFIYDKLLKVTQEKYLQIKYVPYGTDSTYLLQKYLYKYFKDNNVSTKKLIDIGKYAKEKNKIIIKYEKKIKKFY